MSTKVWINGTLVDKADAKVSVYDHGLLYGDGVFEGLRVYSGKVFRHSEHVERLFDSAKAIALKIPMSPDEVMAAVDATVKANAKVDGYVRLDRHPRPRHPRAGPAEVRAVGHRDRGRHQPVPARNCTRTG